MENMRKLEMDLNEVEFNFDVEDLEDIVTPGSGFGCNCN